MTATSLPSHAGEVFSTAPTPVATAHPSRQACSTGSSSGTEIAAPACTIVRVAKVPSRSVCVTTAPSLWRWSRRFARSGVWHRRGSPRRQGAHLPQGERHASTTRSPTCGLSTPSPTSSTTPAPSCPSRIGNGMPHPPLSFTNRSVWQTPVASRRTWTSPGPGPSSASSSTRASSPGAFRRTPTVMRRCYDTAERTFSTAPASEVSPPGAACATDWATSSTNCRYASSFVRRLRLERRLRRLQRLDRLLFDLFRRRRQPEAAPVHIGKLAHELARVVLLRLSDVLSQRAGLFERVEEAAVAHGNEQSGSRHALLQRFPLLLREVGLLGHAFSFDRGAGPADADSVILA